MGLCLSAVILMLVGARPVKGAPSDRRSPRRQAQTGSAPPVEIFHLTTHATYALRPEPQTGGFSSKAMRAITQLLRCHHTGQRHAISRRLVEILYATARHFHSAKLYVIAGYRAPRVARKKGNPNSPHKRGVACDFRLEGVRIETLRDYLRSKYSTVGVGYYPNSGFVHVDVERRRPAYWIDYSGPGQRSRYAKSEQPDENDRSE